MTTAATEIVHYRNICQAPDCDRDAAAKYMPGHCTMHALRLRTHGSLELPPRPPKAPKPPCAVEGCARPSYFTHDMCRMHADRQHKYGDPGGAATRRGQPKPPCAVEGCDRPRYKVNGLGAGLCEAHLYRVRRNGDVGSALIRRCVQPHQIPAHPDRTCVAPGCGRPRYHSRFYCGPHYTRVRKYGSTELPQVDYTCAAPGCERTDHKARGYCSMHHQRVMKYGDPLVVRRRFGEINCRWTGDDASYETMHTRIRVNRGSASTLACVGCGGAAREWAYTGQGGDAERIDHRGLRYSLDIADYEPMCKLCHRRRDAGPRPAVRDRAPREPYMYAHNRVRGARGRASTHPCVDCGEQAQEWAYNNAGGESDRVADLVWGGGVSAVHFSVDVADYDPMCKPCHRHRDALYRAQCARERRP